MMMENSNPDIPRYLPEIPFPAYTYVPGRAPHPASSAGHLQGRAEPPGEVITSTGLSHDPAWLRGLDLFNHGYYWEAHEVWEGSWKANGKRGLIADFLKALIKLAACGVKVREGRPNGVVRHAVAARELLELIAAQCESDKVFELSLNELIADCSIAATTEVDKNDVDVLSRRVFSFMLVPTRE